ncbi:MFS general substrate transporter [Auriscalpium vulgare]|uniref:MFS general substrate transporter n=1 Tax=Auriscalpium vulgare TaxID=40419 RepID=A0ACB8R972_9AGAM|nr:MFS general substrate transporter [Auriscalpium vulgare]
MTDHQFSVALTITYVPYIVMEIPMNLLMKRLGPNITLPLMVALWGVVTACQGAVKSYGGLLACRFFLGALEGGLFPGIVLYMSSFYKRHMLQFRFALMFSVTSLAGAFSGLLAAGIQNMAGDRHLPGWAWIFILEGVFTTVFGLAAFFFTPSKPASVPFLTDAEREAYLTGLKESWAGDNDDQKEIFKWSEVLGVFWNAPQVLLVSIPLFFNGTTLFGLANFTPTIVNAFGHSVTHTQLLTVPPYVCSFFMSIFCAVISDRYKMRGTTAAVASLVSLPGYIIFLKTTNKHKRYGGLFLQIIGVYCIPPSLGTWNANNVQPHYRRATGIAVGFMATNMGGILSTWLFATGAPRFHKATITNVVFAVGTSVACGVLVLYLRWANAAKRQEVARLLREEGSGTEPGGWNSEERRHQLGDRHPCFEYTL